MHAWPSTTSAPVAGLSVGRGSLSLTCLLLAGPHLCSVCVSSFGMMSLHGDLAHTDRLALSLGHFSRGRSVVDPQEVLWQLALQSGCQGGSSGPPFASNRAPAHFSSVVLAGPCASIRKASNDSSRITAQ